MRAVWDEEIGRQKIKHLVEATLTHKPRNGPCRGLTGLYCRSYNKVNHVHQWNALLYTRDELDDYDGMTAHIKGLNKFYEAYDMKISFCLGFAVNRYGVVTRNSCSNVLSTGSRSMPDNFYNQLVDKLKLAGLDVVHEDDHQEAGDGGLADMLGGMDLGARKWPARTKQHVDCKLCKKKGQGVFCHNHAAPPAEPAAPVPPAPEPAPAPVVPPPPVDPPAPVAPVPP